MTEIDEQAQVKRGLSGVYFERSYASDIDGAAGELRYRGYSIHDLAVHSTFEETAYLLLHGELPTANQLSEFDEQLKIARVLPPTLLDIIASVREAHPMDVLRTAVSALSGFDEERGDNTPDAVLRRGIRLTSQIPMVVAAHHHIREGRDPVSANPELAHAENFLHLFRGETPSEAAARLMDVDLILHAEHGSNASSFAARVVTGTDADLHAALTAAVAALSGSAHGGAAENVMRMAQEIGHASNAAAYVRDKRQQRKPVMGFGHRVYRVEDPRARHLRDGVEALSREMCQPQWFDILQAVVAAMKPYSRRGINVNGDFYAGVIYFLQGIPQDMFVPIFAVGRVPGWTAQILEQLDNNILIRPLTLYDGPAPRPYRLLKER